MNIALFIVFLCNFICFFVIFLAQDKSENDYDTSNDHEKNQHNDSNGNCHVSLVRGSPTQKSFFASSVTFTIVVIIINITFRASLTALFIYFSGVSSCTSWSTV